MVHVSKPGCRLAVSKKFLENPALVQLQEAVEVYARLIEDLCG